MPKLSKVEVKGFYKSLEVGIFYLTSKESYTFNRDRERDVMHAQHILAKHSSHWICEFV